MGCSVARVGARMRFRIGCIGRVGLGIAHMCGGMRRFAGLRRTSGRKRWRRLGVVPTIELLRLHVNAVERRVGNLVRLIGHAA